MAYSEQVYKTTDQVSLSVFLKEASDEAVKTFCLSLCKDDQLRVTFWRVSEAVTDNHFRLASLLNTCFKGKFERLVDVELGDEEYYKFEDTLEEAQEYAKVLRKRINVELRNEFAKSWLHKEEVLGSLSVKPSGPRYHMDPMYPIPPMAHRGVGIMHRYQTY